MLRMLVCLLAVDITICTVAPAPMEPPMAQSINGGSHTRQGTAFPDRPLMMDRDIPPGPIKLAPIERNDNQDDRKQSLTDRIISDRSVVSRQLIERLNDEKDNTVRIPDTTTKKNKIKKSSSDNQDKKKARGNEDSDDNGSLEEDGAEASRDAQFDHMQTSNDRVHQSVATSSCFDMGQLVRCVSNFGFGCFNISSKVNARLDDGNSASALELLQSYYPEYPLHEAARYNVDRIIIHLIAVGKHDVNCKNTNGQTALHVAARYGSADVIQQLVECGINIEAKDRNGRTALQIGWHAGHAAVIQSLVLNKADITTLLSASKISSKGPTHDKRFILLKAILEQQKMMDERQKNMKTESEALRKEKENVKALRTKMEQEKKTLDEKYKILVGTIGKTPPPPESQKSEERKELENDLKVLLETIESTIFFPQPIASPKSPRVSSSYFKQAEQEAFLNKLMILQKTIKQLQSPELYINEEDVDTHVKTLQCSLHLLLKDIDDLLPRDGKDTNSNLQQKQDIEKQLRILIQNIEQSHAFSQRGSRTQSLSDILTKQEDDSITNDSSHACQRTSQGSSVCSGGSQHDKTTNTVAYDDGSKFNVEVEGLRRTMSEQKEDLDKKLETLLNDKQKEEVDKKLDLLLGHTDGTTCARCEQKIVTINITSREGLPENRNLGIEIRKGTLSTIGRIADTSFAAKHTNLQEYTGWTITKINSKRFKNSNQLMKIFRSMPVGEKFHLTLQKTMESKQDEEIFRLRKQNQNMEELKREMYSGHKALHEKLDAVHEQIKQLQGHRDQKKKQEDDAKLDDEKRVKMRSSTRVGGGLIYKKHDPHAKSST